MHHFLYIDGKYTPSSGGLFGWSLNVAGRMVKVRVTDSEGIVFRLLGE